MFHFMVFDLINCNLKVVWLRGLTLWFSNLVLSFLFCGIALKGDLLNNYHLIAGLVTASIQLETTNVTSISSNQGNENGFTISNCTF